MPVCKRFIYPILMAHSSYDVAVMSPPTLASQVWGRGLMHHLYCEYNLLTA